jgi:multidrug efflux pump subunit AcrB
MNLIRTALRKPITILVLVAGMVFFGINAVRNIKVDIFPDMNLPVIYISHPFGGYTPTQMEAFFGKQYVNLLLYVSGVKSIETKNIQGLTLMKLTFIKVLIWRKLPPKYQRLVTVRKPYFLLALNLLLFCVLMPQLCQ